MSDITINVHFPDPSSPQIQIREFSQPRGFITLDIEQVSFFLNDRAALMAIRDQINTYLDESVLAEAIKEVSNELTG